MSENILACPYCGSDQVEPRETWGKRYVYCNDCNATGPTTTGGKNDAILLWNAAANALAKKNAEIEKLKQWLKNCIDEEKKRADDATEIQHKLNAEIARLTAALADTEEQRHEAVSKLSLALIREANSDALQDKLEAEIEQLRKERHTMCVDYERVEAERDEARRVARRLYQDNELKDGDIIRLCEELDKRPILKIARTEPTTAGPTGNYQYVYDSHTGQGYIVHTTRYEPPTSRVDATEESDA